jgi:cytochrome P450
MTLCSAQVKDFGFAPRSAAFRANPYPVYRTLRMQAPIYQREKGDWLLTRYVDVADVLKSDGFGRPETPRPSRTIVRNQHKLLRRRAESQRLMKLWFILQNPPVHSRLRQVLSHLYTRHQIQALQVNIQAELNQAVTRLEGQQQWDVMADFAVPVTLYVNCTLMMGIPVTAWSVHFRRWSSELALIADIEPSPLSVERGLLAIAGLADYFRNWIAHHLTCPEKQDNAIRVLYIACQLGTISEEEMIATCIFLFAVGHSSTHDAIGLTVFHLLQHPDQLALLSQQPDLIPQAVTEALRYDCAAQSMARVAQTDVVLSGQQICQGDVVHCLIGAANRDPARFPNPDQLDIRRVTTGSLTMGLGIHTCLGRHLGMLVATSAVQALLSAFPHLTLQTTTPVWKESFLTRGLQSVWVSNQP